MPVMQSVRHGTDIAARPIRVAYLAAGAAGMYCGSCLRDNRLAATLREQGRNVVLIPLYTPLKTDEVDVSRTPIYYGGINVFLEQRFRLFRSLPPGLTRWLDAPALLRRVMRWSSRVRPEDLGELTVSVLRGEHGAQRIELTRLIEGLTPLEPGVVHLPNLPFVGVAAELKRSLRVPVLCTLSGEDIFLDQLREPFRTQAFELIRDAARHVDAFIAVTEYYARFAAAHFQLPRDRIHVVPLGVRAKDFAQSAQPPQRPFIVGYLARVCPAKGLDLLCKALVRLRREGRDCRVVAAGYLAKADQPYLESARAELRRHGELGAFEYLGEVSREEKLRMLGSIHAFSVPTVYHEAKGIYVLEALAAGVPVVQPDHGSFPELIEATGGGLLYHASADDHAGELAATLARLMDDENLRRSLGDQGRAAVHSRFTDDLMADRTWALYEQLCRPLES